MHVVEARRRLVQGERSQMMAVERRHHHHVPALNVGSPVLKGDPSDIMPIDPT